MKLYYLAYLLILFLFSTTNVVAQKGIGQYFIKSDTVNISLSGGDNGAIGTLVINNTSQQLSQLIAQKTITIYGPKLINLNSDSSLTVKTQNNIFLGSDSITLATGEGGQLIINDAVGPGTNGQVLTSNGTNDSWQDATGSSNWTQSGSNLYPTNLSSTIGIGTASPIATLDVTNQSTSQDAFDIHWDGDTWFRISNDVPPIISFGDVSQDFSNARAIFDNTTTHTALIDGYPTIALAPTNGSVSIGTVNLSPFGYVNTFVDSGPALIYINPGDGVTGMAVSTEVGAAFIHKYPNGTGLQIGYFYGEGGEIVIGSPQRSSGGTVETWQDTASWNFIDERLSDQYDTTYVRMDNTGVQMSGGVIALQSGGGLNGNVGIGIATPDASAILDVESTTQGILFPQMTTAEKNAIASPKEGLVVYDLTLHKLCVWTGSTWQTITSI